MKNSLRYLKLWQKKRSEMVVDDDARADWLRMQSLLDSQMPEAKRSSRFKGLRLLPTMFIAFSAAAMVYMVSNIVSLERHKHPIKHSRHHAGPINPGSMVADSLNAIDTLNANIAAQTKDSSLFAGQTAPLQGDSLTKSSTGKPIANNGILANNINPGISRFSVNNKPAALNGQSQNASAGTPISRGAGLANRAPASARRYNTIAHTLRSSTHGFSSKYAAGAHFQSNTLNSNKRSIDDATNSNSVTGNNFNASLPDKSFLTAVKPQSDFSSINMVQQIALPAVSKTTGHAQPSKTKKDKAAKAKNNSLSNIDWGVLTGVNSSGSFTPKSQNANFYGRSPVDVYFGVFASYKLNNTWAINPQVRLFSPQTIITTYSHANQSKVDSNQNLTITASRKVYSVSIPVYAVYNINSNISFKAGPVINFPIKQINANSLLQPATIKADSTYYTNITGILNKTQYDQKLNFGVSAGASIKYKRFIFEATYLKSISGYGVTSGLGSYKSHNGTFQFTIGFQLDKVKP